MLNFIAWLAILPWLSAASPAAPQASNLGMRPGEVCASAAYAHQDSAVQSTQGFSEAIEGNSFFIEEAYNQDRRRVHQMLSVFYFRDSGGNLYATFGQEWPVGGLKHQLSYEIPYASVSSLAASGLQDAFIDYRYQLFGKSDWAAVSPRLSLVLPLGSVRRCLGNGVLGLQAALAASKRLAEHWVVHANAGWSILPKAKTEVSEDRIFRRNLTASYFGGSVVYLATTRFNVLLEYLFSNAASCGADGVVTRLKRSTLSPGIRAAINWGAKQIVPGIAAPLIFDAGKVRLGVFLYLAFENPY